MNLKKLFLIIFLTTSFSSNKALVSVDGIKNLHGITWVISVVDVLDKFFIPQESILPDLHVNLYEVLRNKKINNLNLSKYLNNELSVYAPEFINKILLSSIEKIPGIFSNIPAGYFRVEQIYEKNKNKLNTQNASDLKVTEVAIFSIEKIAESLSLKILNRSIENSRLTKRCIKILMFTLIAICGCYLRQALNESIKKDLDLPELKQVTIDSFIENLVIEFCGEMINFFLLDDPIKQKKMQLKQKHATFS
ncbi:hypothetical protein GF322_01140 [Candidatus Dependentiae bacterium]|nr:hypothetical protein [Candidatus Dependentiae bacterium]